MPVSASSSHLIFDALKDAGVRLVSALPETWLVHLIRLAEEDPDVTLVRLAKEEEGVGLSAGAHLAGTKSAMLMQNHGFLAAVNGIVSGAQLYRIPLLMLISLRGDFGEKDPWQTEGGFPTATSTGTDLAAVARAAGVPRSSTVTTLEDFEREFQAALAGNELATLVAKVEATGPSAFLTDLGLLENRLQFARCLRQWPPGA